MTSSSEKHNFLTLAESGNNKVCYLDLKTWPSFLFGVCGGTLSSNAVQVQGIRRRDTAVRGMRDSGSKQRTGSEDGVTAAAGDTRAGDCRVRLTTFHGGNTAWAHRGRAGAGLMETGVCPGGRNDMCADWGVRKGKYLPLWWKGHALRSAKIGESWVCIGGRVQC